MLLFGILFIITNGALLADSAMYSAVDSLYKQLTRNYSTTVLPVNSDDDTLNITVSFKLIGFNTYDEVNGILSLVGTFSFEWIDHRLGWNETMYGDREYVKVPPETVWTPKLYLVNSADAISVIHDQYSSVKIENTGHAYWKPLMSIKAICAPDMTKYPRDVHNCYLKFTPWGYTNSEIFIQKGTDSIELSLYQQGGKWDVVDSFVDTYTVYNMSFILFNFRFQRIPYFLYVTILAPIIVLSFINSFVFILPVESGERNSFSLTALLSLAVYMTIVANNLPQSSRPMPILCYCLMAIFTYSALITVCNIVVVNLYFKEPSTKTWPCFRFLFSSCIMHRNKKTKYIGTNTLEKTIPEIDGVVLKPKSMDIDSGFTNGNTENNNDFENDQDREIDLTDWKRISTITDRWLLRAFLLVYFACLAGFTVFSV